MPEFNDRRANRRPIEELDEAGRVHRGYADAAYDPKPGTPVYRSEVRPVSEDLHAVAETGRHWTTKPMDYGWGGPGYDTSQGPGRRVVWHGVLDHPDTQVQPQSGYRVFEEDEVRLHPGATVRVLGHSTTQDHRGHVQVGAQPEVKNERQFKVQIRGKASP